MSEGAIQAKVMAAMSMPRLAFTDNLFLVNQLIAMNIDVHKASGAFWEQSLSRMLYKACDEDYDFVLTIDYDTVFKPVDLFYMLRLIVEQKDAAAVFPIQYRRENDTILIGLAGCDDGKTDASRLAAHLTPATIGHFGLTLIRVSALKSLPHPWLHSRPNAEGRWGAGQIDADIGFWSKMVENGHKVFCATRIVIGHLQQTVTWPGEDYLPVHQYANDYFADGDAPRNVIEAAASRAAASQKRTA